MQATLDKILFFSVAINVICVWNTIEVGWNKNYNNYELQVMNIKTRENYNVISKYYFKQLLYYFYILRKKIRP